jgi:hypothetical protein
MRRRTFLFLLAILSPVFARADPELLTWDELTALYAQAPNAVMEDKGAKVDEHARARARGNRSPGGCDVLLLNQVEWGMNRTGSEMWLKKDLPLGRPGRTEPREEISEEKPPVH